MLDRPLFMLGTGRSGTTLAYSLLSRHDDLAWFSSYEERLPRLKQARLAKAMLRIPGLARRNWGSESGLAVRPAEPYEVLDAAFPGFSRPYRTLRAADVTPWASERLRAALEERVTSEGKPRLLLKWTGWSRAGFMDRIFPDGRFLHVHRDGRAVASSLLQQPWWLGWRGPDQWRWGPLTPAQRATWDAHDQSFVALAGLQWQMTFRENLEGLAALPPARVYHLSFEALCEDPVGHCQRVFAWAGLPWSDRVRARIEATPIRPAAVDRWRRDLTPAQAATLDQILAEDLAVQAAVRSGPAA